MRSLQQRFVVPYQYPVHFTTHVFDHANTVLIDTLQTAGNGPHRVLVIVDEGLLHADITLAASIEAYAAHRDIIELACPPIAIAGGEACKHNMEGYNRIASAIHEFGICRQSFVIAIGGGATLDLAGYAAGTSHRGVRLIRMPTTVLAQDDSGVGVKNSINAFGKKNFLGTFAPPYAVINDFAFLRSLSQRDWINGISEVVKVALLKDPALFYYLEDHADALVQRDETAMQHIVHRSAELHLNHIGMGGDPFETTSSRPLDFGHWSAHKLEQLTHYDLRHGEAVAIGLALDCTYSYLSGLLQETDWRRILSLLTRLGFSLELPQGIRLEPRNESNTLLHGLIEFREHLGGELTITLLRGIGRPVDVHHMDDAVLLQAMTALQGAASSLQLETV